MTPEESWLLHQFHTVHGLCLNSLKSTAILFPPPVEKILDELRATLRVPYTVILCDFSWNLTNICVHWRH
jgi:hypothetical protein